MLRGVFINWHAWCKKADAEMSAVENMNTSQDKPVTGLVSKTTFASEILLSASRVLTVFIGLWTRLFQALDTTQYRVAPVGGGPHRVVRVDAEGDVGRTPFLRFRTLTRVSRGPRRLFVPIASFDFENFGVTVRRIAPHQRPLTGIALNTKTKARSRSRASAGHCETKHAMHIGPAPLVHAEEIA